MRCLWIARELPYPTDDGSAIYSARMLDAFRDAGADITVVCRARDDAAASSAPETPGITWRLVRTAHGSSARSVASSLPNIAHRYDTPSFHDAVAEQLREAWDVVVIDNIGAGWALPSILRHIESPNGRRSKLVYISHNHESSVRALFAENAKGVARRQLLRWDARKSERLERRLVEAADLTTVITPDDADSFRAQVPTGRYLVLTPGYDDRVVDARVLTGDLPRRAVIVGSFGWLPKRMNMEEFLGAADDVFAEAGVELLVVGRGPEEWTRSVAARSRATRFTGFVDSVTPYLDDARIGIVAERSGGGFKLKVLHYAFNRIPMAILEGSVAGVPLSAGQSTIQSPTVEALARDVVDAIDDIDRLNRLQEAAFAACAGKYDWSARGRDLAAALRDVTGR